MLVCGCLFACVCVCMCVQTSVFVGSLGKREEMKVWDAVEEGAGGVGGVSVILIAFLCVFVFSFCEWVNLLMDICTYSVSQYSMQSLFAVSLFMP